MGTALSHLSCALTGMTVGGLLLCVQTAAALDDRVIEPAAVAGAEVRTLDEDPLRGLITRRTVTRFGDAFYRRFASEWQTFDTAGLDAVIIEERPTANQGSLITVRYAREVAFRGVVRPQGPAPEELADIAVANVQHWVRQYEMNRGRDDPDLAEEEL